MNLNWSTWGDKQTGDHYSISGLSIPELIRNQGQIQSGFSMRSMSSKVKEKDIAGGINL
jgi:hypothetical protein